MMRGLDVDTIRAQRCGRLETTLTPTEQDRRIHAINFFDDGPWKRLSLVPPST